MPFVNYLISCHLYVLCGLSAEDISRCDVLCTCGLYCSCEQRSGVLLNSSKPESITPVACWFFSASHVPSVDSNVCCIFLLFSCLFCWFGGFTSVAAPCEWHVQPWKSKLWDVARLLFLTLHWTLFMKTAAFPSEAPLGFLPRRREVRQLAFWCRNV